MKKIIMLICTLFLLVFSGCSSDIWIIGAQIDDINITNETTYSSFKIEDLITNINTSSTINNYYNITNVTNNTIIGSNYTAGYGLYLDNITFNVNQTIIQNRVNGSCPTGESIRLIYENGSVICEIDSGGDGNNYPTSLTFLNDILTLGRNGLSDLTTTINLSSFVTSNQLTNNLSLYLLLTDMRFNETNQINSLNETKLNITDQRYNETTYIQNNYPTFNYISNNYTLKTELSGNLTSYTLKTELNNNLTNLNNIYYNKTNPNNYINTSNLTNYVTSSQLTNNLSLYYLATNPNNYITDGNTNWDNSYGFYNSISNFTTTLTNGKICIYNSTTLKIQCDYTDQTSAGGGYTTIDNEDTPLTQRATLNFIGSAIDCVDNAGSSQTDCTITTSGGAGDGTGGFVNTTYETQTNLSVYQYGNNNTQFMTESNGRVTARFENFGYVVATYQRITTAPTIDVTETNQDGSIMNFPTAASSGGDGGFIIAGNTATNTAIINVSRIEKISFRAKMVATTNRRDLMGAFKSATTINMNTSLTGVYFHYNTLINTTISGVVCNLGVCSNVTGITADTNWHEYTIVSNANFTTPATQYTFYIDGQNKGTITTNIPNTQISSVGTWGESAGDAGADTLRLDWYYYQIYR